MNRVVVGVARRHLAGMASPRMVSPAARHLIDSKEIDISGIKGTSRHGIISKSDIVNAIKNGVTKLSKATSATQPQATSVPVAVATIPIEIDETPINSRFTDIPNNNIRKVIAKRLTDSKSKVPHVYMCTECEITELLKLRKELKSSLDVNISVNDIVIKAAALALRDIDQVNNKYDIKSDSIQINSAIDVSVAVATPTGLITPIVTSTDKRSVYDVNLLVKDLAKRAREGKLKPEEYQGGSFSISNLGMFGISEFTAVINPPQACILAVGSGISKVLPPLNYTKGNADKKKPRIGTTVTVQLSFDRRVVNEFVAGEFLQVLSNYLSNPKNLML